MRAAEGGAELWKEGRAEPARAPPLTQAPPSDLLAGGEAARVEGVQRFRRGVIAPRSTCFCTSPDRWVRHPLTLETTASSGSRVLQS